MTDDETKMSVLEKQSTNWYARILREFSDALAKEFILPYRVSMGIDPKGGFKPENTENA
jgi:hypothetical protein